MVSLGRPLALLSFCRSASAFLVNRRSCFYLGSGLIASSFHSQFSVASCEQQRAYHQSHAKMQSDAAATITGYLNAQDAAALDQELMSVPGFSLEQLMELAGLSGAEAVYAVVGPSPLTGRKPKIILVCGPGNNGGDGLVAARHLVMFGYESIVVYPKRSSKQHFINLIQQLEDLDIPVLDHLPEDLLTKGEAATYDAVVDAIFGFSFKGEPREPFASILKKMKEAQESLGIATVSVDIPSGWNVDTGDEAKTGFRPNVLVSLTAPKLSAKEFEGRHFVGGRFLPPKLADKYNIKMPPYPGVSQVMELPSQAGDEGASWEEGYAAYCAEKEAALKDSDALAQEGDKETWEAQYAAYLAEKEAKEFGRK